MSDATPTEPSQIEIDHALTIVREAGYEVGPRTRYITAKHVRVGDIYVSGGTEHSYRVASVEPWVRIKTEGTSFWTHAASDIVEVRRDR